MNWLKLGNSTGTNVKATLKHLARRYFIGNPVKICQKFEGQGITADNCFKLGCVAGPSVELSNLLHEMCHLAEREKDKLLLRPHSAWGFTFGKYWELLGQSGYEAQTDQSVLREARVWSYQLSLSRELGIEESAEELVSSAVYLDAFCLFKFNHIAKGKPYRERERETLQVLAKLVEDQTEVFTFERFEQDWFERMELLK
jgi:hypothetical protein